MSKQGKVAATQNGAPRRAAVTAEEAGAVAGEIAGAVIGSAAGPVGAIAGMVIGAVAGGVVGEVLGADAERKHRHDEVLDETIGVFGGDLGAAKPGSPPARLGAPSLASLGIGGHASTPAEGPMQDVDD